MPCLMPFTNTKKTMKTFNKAIIFKLFCIALTVFSITSVRALTLTELETKMQELNTHSVDYTQSKYLKEADITLDSSGEIISVKDKGVLIKQNTPYKMMLVIKKDSITEIGENEKRVIKAEDNPAVHSLLKLLLNLLTLNDGVDNDFYCTVQGHTDNFNVKLEPKDNNLKNFFNEIRIYGTKYVDKLVIKGAYGDNTIMHLENYDFSDNKITREDLKYFE